MGTLGSEQIVFNRDRLLVISGKAAPSKLDDFVHGGQFATEAGRSATAIAIVAAVIPIRMMLGMVPLFGD